MATNIEHELKTLKNKRIYAEKIKGDATQLLVCVPGPDGSDYAGSFTWWQVVIPDTYPNLPPALFSVTKGGALPHPNLFPDTAARNARRLCIRELRNWPPGGRSLYELTTLIGDLLRSPHWDENHDPNITRENLQGLVAAWARGQV
jgi:ubiquitin-protein ligase